MTSDYYFINSKIELWNHGAVNFSLDIYLVFVLPWFTFFFYGNIRKLNEIRPVIVTNEKNKIK